MRQAWGTFVTAVTNSAAGIRSAATTVGGAPGLLAAAVIILACLAWRVGTGDSRADAQIPLLRGKAPAATARPAAVQKGANAKAPQAPARQLAAMVNGAEIPQAQLAEECVARHGATVLEAIAARHLGAKVTGLSLATNFAAGVTDEPLDHEEVLAAGRDAASTLTTLLATILPVL